MRAKQLRLVKNDNDTVDNNLKEDNSDLDQIVQGYAKARSKLSASFTSAYEYSCKLNLSIYDLLPEEMVSEIFAKHSSILRERHMNHPDRVCTPEEKEEAQKLLSLEALTEPRAKLHAGRKMSPETLFFLNYIKEHPGCSQQEVHDVFGETFKNKARYFIANLVSRMIGNKKIIKTGWGFDAKLHLVED